MSETNKKDWRFRVEDMLESIQKIERSASDHNSSTSLEEDWESYASCERNFQIIAEASKYIPEKIKAEFSDVDWVDVIGMRNFIVHQYDNVDSDVIWRTIQNDLPVLKSVLFKIKKKYQGGVA